MKISCENKDIFGEVLINASGKTFKRVSEVLFLNSFK